MNTLDDRTYFALTLFQLKEGRSIEAYRAFALDYIRPRMLDMDAVLGFVDVEVVDHLVATDGWQLVEIMHITSPTDFNRDNEAPAGAAVAAHWEEWVEDFRVLFVRDLAASPSSV